jgi:chemotaxis protein CheD
MVSQGPVLVRVGRHVVGGRNDRLTAVGLGSCVAVILHDPRARIGGMAHVLLPDPGSSSAVSNPFKFAVTAIPRLVEDLLGAGSAAEYLQARLVGGASMFASLLAPSAESMGDRNVAAEDVGGEYGRTVYFDIGSGSVRVSSVNREEIVL